EITRLTIPIFRVPTLYCHTKSLPLRTAIVTSLVRVGGAFRRSATVAAVICLSIVSAAAADEARAAISIPAQNLSAALKALAEARNLQVLYFSDTVRGLKTQGASGELTA